MDPTWPYRVTVAAASRPSSGGTAAVVMIDQRLLPLEEVYVSCHCWQEVAAAIEDMSIRGAPAIGVAAAMGIALAAQGACRLPQEAFAVALQDATKGLFATRPTAYNLKWALDEMERIWRRRGPLARGEGGAS